MRTREKARIVKRIVKMFLEGMSLEQVVRAARLPYQLASLHIVESVIREALRKRREP